MSDAVMQISNSPMLWLIALSIVLVCAIQSTLYIRHALKCADRIGFDRAKAYKGFRSGAISAIGPSIAVFLVMIGMMTVVGGPITWLRCSIIGAAPTELTAATVGAEAYGVAFGSAEYDVEALSVSFWTMAINGCGWLLFVGLFAHKLEQLREKVGGGDSRWLSVFSVAAALGAYGYLNANTLVPAVRTAMAGIPAGLDAATQALAEASLSNAHAQIVAACGAAVSMVILLKLAKKHTWLLEYTLSFAMVIGMVLAVIV